MLKMSVLDVEQLEKMSIHELSFEQQVQLAQDKSLREDLMKKQLQEFCFEQELKRVQELSQVEASKPSFYDKHFSLNTQEILHPEIHDRNAYIDEREIYNDQYDLARRRSEAQGRKPFERDLRKALHESANDYQTRSDATNSGSDSDSGFASEEREQLEIALQKSCDPAEQYSKEEQDMLFALKLSLKETSPVKSYSCSSPFANDYLGSSQGSSDCDFWSNMDPNDQILLSQLIKEDETPEKLTPLSNEELAYLKPFIEEAKTGNSDVKSLDELEAELVVAASKNNKKKKLSRKSPDDGYFNSGSTGTGTVHTETGARPKSKKSSSAFTVVNRQSPSFMANTKGLNLENSSKRGSPKASPFVRKSPEYSHRMSPPTAKLFNPVEKPCPRRNLDFSHPGSPRKIASSPANGYQTNVNHFSPGNGAYRPIIVDGCNIAFQHGKNDKFSATGLEIVYKYFVNRYGYSKDNFTIVCKPVGGKYKHDQEICDKLYRDDVLVYTPRRHCGDKLIESDDDLFVLNLAKEKGGIVISKDQFRDAYQDTQDPAIKDVIEKRILQFSFKGDEVMFPIDPLGPGGPTLDQFLRF